MAGTPGVSSRPRRRGALLDAVMDKVFVAIVAVALVGSHALSIPHVVLLATRDVGDVATGVFLLVKDKRKLSRPHAPTAFGKLTTVLQYAAAVAASVRSPWVGTFALAAAATGVLATVAYCARERRDSVAARRPAGRRPST